MIAKGTNGQIEFDGSRIKITRKGLIALGTQGLKGDKVIPISNVISVQFKNPGKLFNGYIQFATAGGENTQSMMGATSDENSVFFEKKHLEGFEAIRDAVEAAITTQGSVQVSSNPLSKAEEILKLKQLLDQGILTEEEFQQAKRALL